MDPDFSELPACDCCGVRTTTLYIEEEPGDRLVCGECFDGFVWLSTAGGESPEAEPGPTAGDSPPPFHLPPPFG